MLRRGRNFIIGLIVGLGAALSLGACATQDVQVLQAPQAMPGGGSFQSVRFVPGEIALTSAPESQSLIVAKWGIEHLRAAERYEAGEDLTILYSVRVLGDSEQDVQVTAVYLDRAGREIGRIQVNSDVPANAMGGTREEALRRAGTAIADYALKTF